MKKTIITITIIIFSLSCFSQNIDSVKQAEINKKIIQIEDKTSIQEFKVWLYKNYLTAEKWQEFFNSYNAFIGYKLSQPDTTKQVPNKTKPK